MMKKVLSIILTLGLILSTFAVPSFAEETGAAEATTVTTVKMKTPVNPGASIEVQDFNDMSDAYKTEVRDDVSLANFSRDFGFTVTGNVSADGGLTFIRRHAGKSGNAGDYAVQVIAYGNSTNKIAYMTLDSWKEKVTEGTVVLEYDWLFNPVKNDAEMVMQGMPIAYKYANMKLSNQNTIYDTNFTMAEGQWMSMRYECDVEKNKSSLWINGKQYWDNKDVIAVSDNDLSKLVFHPVFWSGVASDTKTLNSYFCLDNFRVYVLKDVSVTAKKYTVSGVDKTYTDAVPENATELKLALSENVDGLSANDITVSVNGETKETAGFNYADNIITVAMPSAAKSGDVISVKINSNLFEEAIVDEYTVGEEVSAECEIVSPLDNATAFERNGELTLSATATLASNVKFYIDGALVNEFTQADENGEYSFEADASELNYGKHEFKVVSNLGDDTTLEDISEFVLAGSFIGAVNPGVSTDVQNFNSMSDNYATATDDSELIKAFSDGFGWTISGNGIRIKRDAGKSGTEGDYAIGLWPTSAYNSMKLNGWNEKVTSGTVMLEYDWLIRPYNVAQASAVAFTMSGIPSYTNHGGIMLTGTDKSLYNTGFVPGVYDSNYTQWINMRYEFDVANGTCSLWIDGVKYWDNIKTVETSENNLSQLVLAPAFESGANWWLQNKVACFMLDNFRIALDSTTEIKKSTCSFGESEAKIDEKILAGAEKLNITFGGSFDNFSDEKVSLIVNGETVIANSTGSGNLVSVELPSTLKEGDKVEVKLDKSLTMVSQEIGKDIVVEYTVAENTNKTELFVSDCKVNENVFSCNVNVNNLTQSTDKMSIIIASYNDNTLVDLKVYEDEAIVAGGGIIPKTLNLTSDYDEIKVMVWKDMTSYTPWIGTTSFGTEN